MPRVFITGLGFVTSIGNDAPTVGRNLRELRHGFELYPPFQKPDIPVKITGTIKEFTTEPFFLTELVDHLPSHPTVPTPEKVLGHIIGAPNVKPTARRRGYPGGKMPPISPPVPPP